MEARDGQKDLLDALALFAPVFRVHPSQVPAEVCIHFGRLATSDDPLDVTDGSTALLQESLSTGDQAALGARPDFFGVHVEERGGLVQVQRVHGGVESGISSPLLPCTQEVELAQDMAVLRPRGAIEGSVEEILGRAHIDTRKVASATVTVAQTLGGCCSRLPFAIALSTVSLDALLCESATSGMAL